MMRSNPTLNRRVSAEAGLRMRRPCIVLMMALPAAWLSAGTVSAAPPSGTATLGANARAVDGTSAPESLSAADWSSIRAAYQANRYAAVTVDDGYQARNPRQQWRTRFDGRGFLTTPNAGGWSWGLELVGYGRAGAEQPVDAPCVDADGGRVRYEWDDVLTEWYVNDRRGLEHGYTVHRRPGGGDASGEHCSQSCGTAEASAPLEFALAVRGGLIPRVSDNGRDVSFIAASGAAVMHYRGLTVLDADGAGVPAWFASNSGGLRLTVDDRAARYPLTIDPLAQQAYLKASNTEAGDYFGDSVSVSGDTAVVGAMWEDSSAPGVNGDQADNSATLSGAAYVFVRDDLGVWSQQAYFKASNPDPNDWFGRSVSISGDTLVVGASHESSRSNGVDGEQANNNSRKSGAAYVFVRDDLGIWSQQAYLKASNANTGRWDVLATRFPSRAIRW